MMSSVNDFESPDIHSSSDEYATRFSGEFGEFALKVQGDAVLKILNNYTDIKTVLDVGGGHGQITPYLINKNYDVTIYGSSDCCKKRVESYINNYGVKFSVGSLLNLPFNDKAFDVVICFRQVCHLDNWQALISELSRVSKHLVIIDYPTYKSFNIFNRLLFSFKKKVEKNTRPFTIFFDNEIKNEFLKNDFTINMKIPEYFLPLVFYRIIKKKVLCNFCEKIFGILGLRTFFGSPVIVEAKRKK